MLPSNHLFMDNGIPLVAYLSKVLTTDLNIIILAFSGHKAGHCWTDRPDLGEQVRWRPVAGRQADRVRVHVGAQVHAAEVQVLEASGESKLKSHI